MTDSWLWTCTRLGDAVFGWALSFPRDLAVVLVGAVLALILLAVRRVTTDPNRLRQIANDEGRLRELIRSARVAADGERLARYRRVKRLVASRRARSEWIAVFVSLIISAAVMQWGGRRLEYLPIRVGEPIRFVARFPASFIGEVVHVVPLDQATVTEGWMRTVRAFVESGTPGGTADWTIRFEKSKEPCWVVVRLQNQSAVHPLIVGTAIYEATIRRHDGGLETEVMLIPYRPLGLIPAHVWPGVPGWVLLLTLVTGGVYLFGVRVLPQLTINRRIR